jgi:hypothetical protein
MGKGDYTHQFWRPFSCPPRRRIRRARRPSCRCSSVSSGLGYCERREDERRIHDSNYDLLLFESSWWPQSSRPTALGRVLGNIEDVSCVRKIEVRRDAVCFHRCQLATQLCQMVVSCERRFVGRLGKAGTSFRIRLATLFSTTRGPLAPLRMGSNGSLTRPSITDPSIVALHEL